MNVSIAVVNGDLGTLITLASPPLLPIMVTTCTTLSSISMNVLSHTNAPVMSCDTTNSMEGRLTPGVDIQAVPVPSFVPPIGMTPSATVMEAGTWGASTLVNWSQLDNGLN